VTALARTDAKASALDANGARPARVDLFDAPAVRAAVAGHDAVVNLATNIPSPSGAWRAEAWATNDRIRREGSTILADAALAAGAERYVQESISFTYPDRGDQWIDEQVPIEPSAGVSSVRNAEAAAARVTEAGQTGIVLRFAFFYGPDSTHSDLTMRAARRHIGLVFGAPSGYISSIHLADVASAVVASLRAPAGTYNIGDDVPVTRREYAGAVGRAVGREPWFLAPAGLARFGGARTETLVRSHRISNVAFRTATGWAPAYPSVETGWPAVVAAEAAESEGAKAHG
jgi:nucleoside-diphosphate-sugar epimerase